MQVSKITAAAATAAINAIRSSSVKHTALNIDAGINTVVYQVAGFTILADTALTAECLADWAGSTTLRVYDDETDEMIELSADEIALDDGIADEMAEAWYSDMVYTIAYRENGLADTAVVQRLIVDMQANGHLTEELEARGLYA